MTKRIVILQVGDTHAGSKYGLLHPETELERETETGEIETYNPPLTEIQRFLFYKVYRPAVQEAVRFAGKDDIYAIHMGDPTDGIAYIEDKATLKVSDQILMADKNAQEILQYPNVKAYRMIRSTASHAFGDASEELLLQLLRRQYPEKDIAVHSHGLYTIDQVDTVIDAAHHGPSAGIRKWLEGNNFRYYIRDIVIREMLKRRRPPDIISRAHTHTAHKEFLGIENHDFWGIINPPMQWPTTFAKKVTKSVYDVKIGVTMIEVILHDSGRKTIYPFFLTKEVDIRNKEIL